MAVALWPATLPQSVFIGVTDQRRPAVVRTASDGGVDKIRRRFTSTPRDIDPPIVLTVAQRATFDTFFITTLKEGSLPFEWDDPVDDSTVQFRWRSPPQWRMIAGGAAWAATLPLELMP
jgi:hypothetical protein